MNKKELLLQWVVFGHIGISSKTMWAAIMDINPDNNKISNSFCSFDIPYDGDDFSRCYKLYKKCKLDKEDLKKVSDVFPYWKPFIDNWDKLCVLYENKISMYQYIQNLANESRIIKIRINQKTLEGDK